MYYTDAEIAVEIAQAVLLLGALAFLWRAGQQEPLYKRPGWGFMVAGLALLFIGAVLDITDNFPALSRFVVIGPTPAESFLEEFLCTSLGLGFLVWGIFKWLPLAHRLGAEQMRRATTETALKESDERLRLTIEATRDAIWDWDIAAGTVYRSPRWNEMLHPDIAGNKPGSFDHLHPADREIARTRMQDHLAGRTPIFETEGRALNKERGWTWLLMRGRVVSRDRTGKPLRIAGTVTDIDDRKRKEMVIESIAENVSGQTGEEFMRALAEGICKSLDVEYAYIGVLDETDPRHIQTVAIYAPSGGKRNIKYNLKGTPCALVVEECKAVHFDRAQKEFSEDRALVEKNIDGYLGFPLMNREGKCIGLISILSTRPIRHPGDAVSALGVFASRAVAEIERTEAVTELTRREATLKIHQDAIGEILQSGILNSTDLNAAIRELTETCAVTLQAGRAAIWRFSDNGRQLSSLDVYDRRHACHGIESPIEVSSVMAAVQALRKESVVAIADVNTDPRADGLRDVYSRVHGIQASIFTAVGDDTDSHCVISACQYGEPRKWTIEEKAFLRAIADIAAVLFLSDAREKAVRGLAESEAHLRGIVDQMPAALDVRDLQARYLRVNRRYTEWYGFDEKSTLGRTNSELFADWTQSNADSQRHHDEVIATGKIRHRDIVRRLANGATRALTVTKFPIYDHDGQIVAVGSFDRDVTERRQMESALRESEQRFKDAIEGMADGFALFDSENRLVLFNSSFPGSLGKQGHTIHIGMYYEELLWRIAPYSAPRLGFDSPEAFVKARIADHRALRTSIGIFPDGRWMEIRRSRTSTGGTVLIRRDITAQRQAESALKESEQRLRDAMDAMYDGFALFNADDRLILCNSRYGIESKTVAELIAPGISIGEIVSVYVEAVDPADIGDAREAWICARLDEFKRLGTSLSRLRDGRWIEYRRSRSADGGTVVVSRDFTAQKRAEDALKEGERKLRDAIESMNDGFMLFDKDGRLLAFNSRVIESTTPIPDNFGVGLTYREMSEFQAQSGEFDLGEDTPEQWVERKLREHRDLLPAISRLRDGTWLETRRTRAGNGGTVMIRRDITQQMHAEEALKNGERKLRDAIESMNDGFLLFDKDDKLVLFNRNIVENTLTRRDLFAPGTPYEVFARHHATSGIVVDIGESTEEWISRRLDDHRNLRTTVSHMRDGRWIEYRRTRAGNGGTMMIRRDITQQKRAEEALKESEQRLRDAVESLADGFSLYDAEDRLVMFNTKVAGPHMAPSSVFVPGATAREILTHYARSGDIEDIQCSVEEWVERRLADHAALRTTISHYNNGRWIEYRRARTTDGGTVIIRRDITQQKLAENALRETAERYQNLVEQSPDAIVALVEGRVAFANRVAGRLFGVEPSDRLLGMFMVDLVDPRYHEKLLTHFGNLRTDGAEPAFECRFLKIDGTFFIGESTASTISYNGRTAIQTVIRDTTHQHEIEAQLIHSVKLATLGETSASMVHELSQPLNIIKLTAEGLLLKMRRNKVRPEQQKEQIEIIDTQASRMGEIVDYMRVFSRKDTESQEYFDAVDAVSRAVDFTRPQLRSDNVKIKLRLPRTRIAVLGREIHLEQVLTNLIMNARDAIAEKSDTVSSFIGIVEIGIRVCKKDSHVVITVADNGKGIPHKDAEHLFAPFFTTKGVGKGTGLGLSVSKGIVERMAGTIEAKPAAAGAIFEIRLPCMLGDSMGEPADQDFVDPEPTPAAAFAHRILVVDDEAEAAQAIAKYLADEGFETDVAGDGEAALALFEKDPHHLVITDLRMPKMDGKRLIQRLRSMDPSLPIVVMTGDSGAKAGLGDATGELTPLIRKPVSLASLRGTIERLLGAAPTA